MLLLKRFPSIKVSYAAVTNAGPGLALALLLSSSLSARADTLSDIDALLQQATKDNGESNFSDAETHFRSALSLSSERLGAMSPTCGRVSRQLGEFYMNRGRYGDAERYLYRSLVVSAGYSGAVSDSEGDFTNTKRFINDAIQNPSQLPGSLEVSNSLSSIANLFTKEGRYQDAERILKRLVQIFQGGASSAGSPLSYSSNSAQMLSEYQRTLAQLYYKEGNVLDAETMFKASVETVRKEKGPSAELADALKHLSVFYKSQSRSSEADASDAESKELLEHYR